MSQHDILIITNSLVVTFANQKIMIVTFATFAIVTNVTTRYFDNHEFIGCDICKPKNYDCDICKFRKCHTQREQQYVTFCFQDTHCKCHTLEIYNFEI